MKGKKREDIPTKWWDDESGTPDLNKYTTRVATSKWLIWYVKGPTIFLPEKVTFFSQKKTHAEELGTIMFFGSAEC